MCLLHEGFANKSKSQKLIFVNQMCQDLGQGVSSGTYLKSFEIGGGKGVTHTELSNGLKHKRIQLLKQHLGYESVFGVQQ